MGFSCRQDIGTSQEGWFTAEPGLHCGAETRSLAAELGKGT